MTTPDIEKLKLFEIIVFNQFKWCLNLSKFKKRKIKTRACKIELE